MMRRRKLATTLGTALLVAAALPLGSQVNAADHADAPITTKDAAADIADIYAWHTERGTIVIVLTFDGLRASGDAPNYDSGVLYTIHVDNTADAAEKQDPLDNDNDNESDIQIKVRFGQNNLEEWGVQFNDVPGADGPTFDGPVGTTIMNGTATVTAGDFDDPFFFDLDGFRATRDATIDDADPADLMFASLLTGTAVDFFAGTNVQGIVVELDAATVVNGNADNFIQVWGTTGRVAR